MAIALVFNSQFTNVKLSLFRDIQSKYLKNFVSSVVFAVQNKCYEIESVTHSSIRQKVTQISAQVFA